ncbi:hypothetical protein L5515_016146 [Caenorhabditis briggsae]|uniref:Uncharacterized protein n=1 Tax=Caenorhabditis briggsae TaxID=6238 RepID=A0AAE9JPI4_CAEBR|nr:hypothetical protein L3Y34_010257 [Caenorhabditis briggsae]UMM38835.1 hypothetical protein L5515_016146 [Caenorhabditis briggsae]
MMIQAQMLYKPHHNHNSTHRKEPQHKNSTNSNSGSSRSRCDEAAPLASPEQEFIAESRSVLMRFARLHCRRH